MTARNRVAGVYRFFAVSDCSFVLWDRCIDCLDDDDAYATARTLSDVGATIEVWEVARFVGSFAIAE